MCATFWLALKACAWPGLGKKHLYNSLNLKISFALSNSLSTPASGVAANDWNMMKYHLCYGEVHV